MRIRTIKPEFWTHPVLCRMDDSTKLLAIGLLNYADDDGYFFAEPKMVQAALFPLREDYGRTTVGLRELSGSGYIELRTHPTHGLIGRVTNFNKHQCVNKRRNSVIAQYFQTDGSATVGLPEDYGRSVVGLPSGTGNREQGMEQGTGVHTPAVAVVEAKRLSIDEIVEQFKDKHTLGWTREASAWSSWMRHRYSKRGVKDWVTFFDRQWDMLLALPFEARIACLTHSTTNGYTGLFPDKFARPGANQAAQTRNAAMGVDAQKHGEDIMAALKASGEI